MFVNWLLFHSVEFSRRPGCQRGRSPKLPVGKLKTRCPRRSTGTGRRSFRGVLLKTAHCKAIPRQLLFRHRPAISLTNCTPLPFCNTALVCSHDDGLPAVESVVDVCVICVHVTSNLHLVLKIMDHVYVAGLCIFAAIPRINP